MQVNMHSVSKQSSYIKTTINTRPITFIDTPGFCDVNISMSKGNEEMVNALLLAKAGVHAFAFVLDATSRFSQAHSIALQDFQKFEQITPFTFVLFVKARQLSSCEAEQQNIISEMLNDQECPVVLKQFMEKIGFRYIMVESVDYMAEDYYIKKSSELIDKIDDIFLKNRIVFTCSLMDLAKQAYVAQERVHKQSNPAIDEMAVHAAAALQLQSNLAEAEQRHTERITEAGMQDSEIPAGATATRGATFCAFSLIGATIGTYIWPMLGTVVGALAGVFIGKKIYEYAKKTQ